MALELKTKRSLIYKKLIGAFFVFAMALQPMIVANFHNVFAVGGDTSSTTFVNDPKYVRQNNGGDLAAQIVTPDTTIDVRFYLDGDTGTTYPGQNIGGAETDTSWWRLYTPLAAGEHTVSAEIKTDGDWQTIADTGTVYSLDTPWAEYVIPKSNQSFRPNDRVVRVKADDEFDQFSRMVTVIDGVSYEVQRGDCNDQGAYVLCDLSGLDLDDGVYTAKTTTYTKANNRADNVLSPSFTIDGTPPQMQNAKIVSPVLPTGTPYQDSVDIAQYVKEANAMNGVSFYATKPRSDGQCDPNQPKVIGPIDAHFVNHNPANGTWSYRTTVDTSGLDGTYCFFSVAEDAALNHSDPQDGKFSAVFDNNGPAVTITSPSGTVTNKDHAITITGTVDENDVSGVSRVDIQVKNGSTALDIDNDGSPQLIQATVNSDGTWQATIPANTLPEGDLTIVAISKDGLDHTDTDTQDITVDNTAPALSGLTATQNPDSTYTLSVATDGTATSVTFKLDGADWSATSADGTTWTATTGVLNAETDHILAASAADAVGNISSAGPSNFSVPAVVVNDVPSETPTLLGHVTPPVNNALTRDGATTTTPADKDGDVLGATDTNNNVLGATDQANQPAAIARSPQGWKLWGIAWYWWVAIVAGLGGAGWWLLAGRQHTDVSQP